MIVGYYKNYLYTTDKVSSEKKNNNNNEESQYMVSHPETGSDSPIGLGQDRGRDSECSSGRQTSLLVTLNKHDMA